MESSKPITYFEILRSRCCCKSNGLVSSPTWSSSFRRRNSRQDDKIQKYFNRSHNQDSRCRISSVQFDVLEDIKLNSQHTWILAQLDKHLEISKDGEGSYSNRAYLSGFVSSNEPRRKYYRNGCRRLDAEILECVPKQELDK